MLDSYYKEDYYDLYSTPNEDKYQLISFAYITTNNLNQTSMYESGSVSKANRLRDAVSLVINFHFLKIIMFPNGVWSKNFHREKCSVVSSLSQEHE